MSMTITHLRACDLARTLAQLTGTDLQAAVLLVLEEAIAQRSASAMANERFQRMSGIADRFALQAHAGSHGSLWNDNEDLQDDRGLPS